MVPNDHNLLNKITKSRGCLVIARGDDLTDGLLKRGDLLFVSAQNGRVQSYDFHRLRRCRELRFYLFLFGGKLLGTRVQARNAADSLYEMIDAPFSFAVDMKQSLLQESPALVCSACQALTLSMILPHIFSYHGRLSQLGAQGG